MPNWVGLSPSINPLAPPPLFQVLWSAELAYLTVVLADSVTSEQLQALKPPTQDFPSLEPTKQVNLQGNALYIGQLTTYFEGGWSNSHMCWRPVAPFLLEASQHSLHLKSSLFSYSSHESQTHNITFYCRMKTYFY